MPPQGTHAETASNEQVPLENEAQSGDSPRMNAQETKENQHRSLNRQSYFFKKGKL
jgi:hypothetical protein